MENLETQISSMCPLPFSGIAGEIFLKAVSTVVAVHCTILDDFHWPPDNSREILEEGSGISFDFIVVGAGTAGSLLASRLSNAFPSWKILLIEAGDDPGIDTEIPAFLFLNQNSSNDWSYKTHPDGNSCLGFKDNSCIWSKGKGLGGSSSINAMIYLRGHPKDYAEWYNLGNPGWDYENLVTHFNEQEALFKITDPEFKGYDNEWYKILDNAWNELNFTSHNYESHEAIIGTKKTRLLTQNGKRMNTAKQYFKETDKLFVMKNTLVEKVIIDPLNKQASGVVVKHKSGIIMNITANKEVILSAGSIATPQILMMSGIGPKSHLDEIGIECHQNLKVGQNLQDHVLLPLFLKTNMNMTTSTDVINILLLQYMLTKTGPFSNIGLTDYMGFIDTERNLDYPDIQFHYFYFTKNDNFVLKPYLEGLGYKIEIIEAIEDLNKEHDFLGIYPTLLRPKSTGEILLPKRPLTAPIIKANYFQHPDDVRTFLRAIDFVHKLEKTSILREMGIELLNVSIRTCNEHLFNTDNYWRCYISHMATTIYHPVGTAKMGPRNDVNAVVNHDLQIHGISNFRVVDASIMPTIPGGNTMAATLVIARKAVDIIKKHYDSKDEL
ncbi:glucose dehydrogenase [FAD, quinone]-like isoform X1 [Vanessa atalanta]|uniref:glucose dehydrogenase [FAD, quinone]-like isoform X1 n=1 Tax=Vanessa atalanta TaxID=42275 RepID=UPI001FCCF2E0|nr:glucose dehydrogenase [FAD, quinone]-like isoform X1 [Vanessa atalanta]